MKYKASKLQKGFKEEYKMEAKVFPFGQDVTFFGTKLECYKMAYQFKNKESKVEYSENMKTWSVSFPCWFSLEFSQKIDN